MLRILWRCRRGQDLVEYALLVAVVAITGGVAIVPVAPTVNIICSKLVSLLSRY